jgi:hypothetical protein
MVGWPLAFVDWLVVIPMIGGMASIVKQKKALKDSRALRA